MPNYPISPPSLLLPRVTTQLDDPGTVTTCKLWATSVLVTLITNSFKNAKDRRTPLISLNEWQYCPDSLLKYHFKSSYITRYEKKTKQAPQKNA